MQVTYKLEESDLVPYSRLVAYRKPLGGLFAWLPLLLFAILVLVISILSFTKGTPITPITFLVPLVMMWTTIIYPALIRRKIARRWRETQGAFGIQTLIWRPEGIRLNTTAGEEAYAWKAIDHVVKEADTIYLWPGNAEAIIVPKRAFPSETDWQAFYNQARAYWEGRHDPADSWPPAPAEPG